MTLKSYELVPILSTPAKIEKARKAMSVLRARAGRPVKLMASPETNFPTTPGEGGWENQKSLHYLVSWFLDQDINALHSALNLAKWLRATWAKRDRAHGQRYAWWSIIGRAAAEQGLCLPEEFDADFIRWYSYLAADPYVNGKYTGSTLRPFIRVHGAAIQAAWIAERLPASLGTLSPTPAVLRAKAINSLVAWANTWHTYGSSRWGFRHDEPRPAWDDFPYCDAKDWPGHTRNMTCFMAAMIVPHEAMMVRLHVSNAEWKSLERFKFRAMQMARHAVAWGVDPVTSKNMKAIGSGKPGSYLPPGFGGPNDPPEMRADTFFEPGYHDWSLALMAYEANREARQGAVIGWTKQCRALAPGEIPPGLVVVATELFS